MSSPAFRRVLRRETHSARTVAMIVTAVLVLLAVVYAGVEIVLALAARPPLLVDPRQALTWVAELPAAEPRAAVIAGAVVVALLGLVLTVLALAPGRLSKHEMGWENRAVVVDNGVVASSLAQHLSEETGVERDRIVVGVAHRAVDITVRPDSGTPLEEAAVRAIAEEELAGYRLSPSVKTRARLAASQERGLSE